MAEVGWTHRASCPPGGRKASWRARALAGRKLEAPPDAGHEQVEGESVRERGSGDQKYALVRFMGFGSWALHTTEGVLGLRPVWPSPVRRIRVLGSQVNSQWHHPRGACHGQRIGRRLKESRSGVPAGDSESVRGSTRFGEGGSRSEKVRGSSASSALKRRGSSGAPRRDCPEADGSE